jgi:CHAT domain-containing protein
MVAPSTDLRILSATRIASTNCTSGSTKDDPSGLGEAKELAELLLKHKIPIAILNACQSGKQVGAEESSLAAQLLEAGMQSALGMAWSVTVSAAERLIPKLYGDLFAGRSLGSAVLAGRRELAADKERRAAYNETIELEDWRFVSSHLRRRLAGMRTRRSARRSL